MTDSPDAAVRVGVLRDYPVRLWARQQQHSEELLREFQLLVFGQEGDDRHHAPRRLVALADRVTTSYGPMLTAINEERQAALDAGRDRIDSRVVMVPELPELLAEVRDVLAAADEYCRSGALLVLPRPDDVVRMSDWVLSELEAQYEGAEPTPWPGPF